MEEISNEDEIGSFWLQRTNIKYKEKVLDLLRTLMSLHFCSLKTALRSNSQITFITSSLRGIRGAWAPNSSGIFICANLKS